MFVWTFSRQLCDSLIEYGNGVIELVVSVLEKKTHREQCLLEVKFLLGLAYERLIYIKIVI